MNPFASRINRGSWELPVSALCLVLGVMISLTLIKPSNRASRIGNLSAAQYNRVATTDTELQDQYNKLSAQVQHLQQDNTKLQDAMANESNQGKVLNQSLQDTKLFAGLTEVEGPGRNHLPAGQHESRRLG